MDPDSIFFQRRNPPPDPAPAVTLISKPCVIRNKLQLCWWVNGKGLVGPFLTRQAALHYLAQCSYDAFRLGLDNTRPSA